MKNLHKHVNWRYNGVFQNVPLVQSKQRIRTWQQNLSPEDQKGRKLPRHKVSHTVECNWVYRKWLLSGQWEWTLSGDSRWSWSRGFSEKKLPQINPSHSVKFEMGLFTKRDVKWTYITVIFGNYKITVSKREWSHSLLLLVNQGWSDVIKLSQVKLSSGWTTCFSLLHSLVSSSNWFT